MLSFSAISRVVLCRLFSIIAFILSSSASVGRPERGASLRSKSPERKAATELFSLDVISRLFGRPVLTGLSTLFEFFFLQTFLKINKKSI